MKHYSFADTILLINGVEATGWDEGDDVINMARLNPSANHVIGAGGEMTVSISADRSGTVTFRLLQSSSFNAYLTGLINTQENGAFIPVFVQFKDIRSGDLISGTQGYIPKPADAVRGTNAQPQEWEIICERLDMLYIGGANA